MIVATHAQREVATTIATTTSPAKGNADCLVFLKDSTIVVQNVVADASEAVSSIAPVFTLSHVGAPIGADVMAYWFEDQTL